MGFNTRTIIFDFQDLDNPTQHMIYNGPTSAIDHNGYVKGSIFYLANYRAGVRMVDISGIGNKNVTEIGYFDTFPSSNSASFNGVWNVYPYFNSGNIVISDIEGGFFLIKKSTSIPPSDGCSDTVTSFPFTESFESNFGLWENASGVDDINWARNSGGTPSNSTGPSGASDGNTYIYVEASGNGTGFPNKSAILNSPCFDFSGLTSPALTFQYHMLGNSINSLTVEARTNNQGAWRSLFSRNGSQGSNWNSANIDLTTYAGQTSVQMRFIVVTGSGSQGWQSDIAMDAVSIQNSGTNPDTCASLNFNDYQITSFSNQDAAGNFSIEDAGTSLVLNNNTWKHIPLDYTITSNTVLEFEFSSSSEGEIHAIGFENDNNLTSTRYFKVHGTQNYGVTNYDTYTSGVQKFVIPVGGFYTGVMDRLIFINDDDSGSGNESVFSLVKIYEGSCGNTFSREPITANLVPVFGNQDENILAMKVYPNPVSGPSLNLFLNTDLPANYEILNIQGQLVDKGNVLERIDVSNLNSGVYFLRVSSTEQENSVRFIKQ